MSKERSYPLIQNDSCRVVLRPETGLDSPPIQLPQNCINAATNSIPKPYDFSLEHNIIKRQVDREQEWSLGLSSSREELQQNVLARMKSVTNASEDVCVSLLEENSYDLKTSIETYLYNSAF